MQLEEALGEDPSALRRSLAAYHRRRIKAAHRIVAALHTR